MADLKCTVEEITPKMAKEYLANNCEYNRRVNDRRVAIYAEDMKAGEWQLNGEAIQFNKHGILINGQHRLNAIIRAGIPVKMMVVRGVEDNVDLFDRGNARSTYQSLLMGGIDKELANNLTCAMAKLYQRITVSDNYVSDSTIRDFLLNNEDTIIKAYNICMKNSSGGSKKAAMRVGTNSAMFAVSIFSALRAGESEDDLIAFCSIVSSGLYDNKNQTAAAILRNDFLAGYFATRDPNSQKKSVHMIEKAIYDFCRRKPRNITYKSWDKPIYTKKEG